MLFGILVIVSSVILMIVAISMFARADMEDTIGHLVWGGVEIMCLMAFIAGCVAVVGAVHAGRAKPPSETHIARHAPTVRAPLASATPKATVTITVTESDTGEVVANATVQIDCGIYRRTVKTDASGSITVEGQPINSPATISASAEGRTGSISVPGGFPEGKTRWTVLVKMAAQPPVRASLSGTVTDASTGQGVICKVEIYDGGGNLLYFAASGTDGKYLFPGLPEGDYTVRFSGGGLEASKTVTVATGLNTLDAQLQPTQGTPPAAPSNPAGGDGGG
ncbi:MAG: collagen binding domain-containing protein [Fimbriimonadales bacterium]